MVGLFSAKRLPLFWVWQGGRGLKASDDWVWHGGGVKNFDILSDILFEWPHSHCMQYARLSHVNDLFYDLVLCCRTSISMGKLRSEKGSHLYLSFFLGTYIFSYKRHHTKISSSSFTIFHSFYPRGRGHISPKYLPLHAAYQKKVMSGFCNIIKTD